MCLCCCHASRAQGLGLAKDKHMSVSLSAVALGAALKLLTFLECRTVTLVSVACVDTWVQRCTKSERCPAC
jgi:hypothetical protein